MSQSEQRGQLRVAKVTEPKRALKAADRAVDGDGFVTSERAAAYAGYDGVSSPDPLTRRRALNAFREWVRSKGITTQRRGRRLLFRRVAIDRAVGASHRGGL